MVNDLDSLLEPVIEIANRAGEAILEIYAGEFEVETKDDRSPLTEADRASHRLICDALSELTPAVPVWSEESAAIPFETRAGWPEFWLVDPLDGTKEFIKRNGEFTVNIAFVQGHEPVLGIVQVPDRKQVYYGHRDGGAFVRRAGAPPRRLQVAANAAAPVRVVGSRSHRGSSLEQFLQAVGPHEIVPMGSSLKFCVVAAGDADVYPRLGPTSEWDTAAAQAVVENAGGQVLDLDGHPIRYNTKPEVLNPYFVVFGDPSRDWLALTRGVRSAD
jgi:3'(2'), 5'-bisphosphate nucleotidase